MSPKRNNLETMLEHVRRRRQEHGLPLEEAIVDVWERYRHPDLAEKKDRARRGADSWGDAYADDTALPGLIERLSFEAYQYTAPNVSAAKPRLASSSTIAERRA